MTSLDRIRLHGLRVDCVMGIYPHERTQTQEVRASLDLALDTSRAGASGRLDGTVDYARLAFDVAFVLREAQFGLLESAAEALSALLLRLPRIEAANDTLRSVRLSLQKPDVALLGAVPEVCIERTLLEPVQWRRTDAPERRRTVIWDGEDCLIEHMYIMPSDALLLSKAGAHTSILALGDGLELGHGDALSLGARARWAAQDVVGVRNTTDAGVGVLHIMTGPRAARRIDAVSGQKPARAAIERVYPPDVVATLRQSPANV